MPPLVVNTSGVNVACSTSITRLAYIRFFSFWYAGDIFAEGWGPCKIPHLSGTIIIKCVITVLLQRSICLSIRDSKMESVATKVLYRATLNPFLSYSARYRNNRFFFIQIFEFWRLRNSADAHIYRLSGSYVCKYRPWRQRMGLRKKICTVKEKISLVRVRVEGVISTTLCRLS